MKKGWKFLAAALTGALAGASIYKITGKRQKKAQKTGRHIPYGPYEAAIKRPLDCILATGAVLLLSPVILVTGVLVRLKLGSPVLFTQERPGLDGKLFKLYKFRTMVPDAEQRKKESCCRMKNGSPHSVRSSEVHRWMNCLN